MAAIKRLDPTQIQLIKEREILERFLPNYKNEAEKAQKIVDDINARLLQIKIQLKNRREGNITKVYKKDGRKKDVPDI